MFIDKYNINVLDSKWEEKTSSYTKKKFVVANINDDTGISSKNFGKFLDDIIENNYTFSDGTVEVIVNITKR